ncbi:nodulin-16-like [Glycine soja]|uniref:Nodulin-16 n=1 Tax=Glycine soja TaxID=3848 RepID=A0A0B2RW48_GLYSO|nr:nodulin-16-like [Glycine soja]KHN36464.1 Nodulin-16 [Glycine soja]RZC29651.1 Nodulin-16 isoform A [Glycine soja]RZC29652.1 Nodulin-16 isoform B [Glycine soja]RZC29653.1 Nodulin-16 isoform C [Glycine soja]
MDSKTKIALLIPGMLAMLLLFSKVAARDFNEGEVVKETNEEGNAKSDGGGGDLHFMSCSHPTPSGHCPCGCCSGFTESGGCEKCCASPPGGGYP